MPIESNGPSSRCAIAGSLSAPRPSEQMVMPSCAQAIITETFSIARNVVAAVREPFDARTSIWVRRAEISANSAPTKKALAPSRTTVRARARESLMRRPPRPPATQEPRPAW